MYIGRLIFYVVLVERTSVGKSSSRSSSRATPKEYEHEKLQREGTKIDRGLLISFNTLIE